MVTLTETPINLAPLLEAAQQPRAGAVVVFLGVAREFTAGRQTAELVYDAYGEMAQKELARLEARAREQWPLVECCLAHRTGRVPISEASVAVVVSAAHRGAAFEAARWLIDELKKTAPIWKRERWADGREEWVHPNDAREGEPRP